jgi:hypothetical protein
MNQLQYASYYHLLDYRPSYQCYTKKNEDGCNSKNDHDSYSVLPQVPLTDANEPTRSVPEDCITSTTTDPMDRPTLFNYHQHPDEYTSATTIANYHPEQHPDHNNQTMILYHDWNTNRTDWNRDEGNTSTNRTSRSGSMIRSFQHQQHPSTKNFSTTVFFPATNKIRSSEIQRRHYHPPQRPLHSGQIRFHVSSFDTDERQTDRQTQLRRKGVNMADRYKGRRRRRNENGRHNIILL